MKKFTFSTLSVLVLTVFLFTGCGKYEDGPGFTLRTKNGRITGDWKLTSISGPDATYNGIELSQSGFSIPYSYTMTLEKDGMFESTEVWDGDSQVAKGLWSWVDGSSRKEMVDLPGIGRGRITRLSSKELVIVYPSSDGDTTYEFEAE